LKEAKKKKFPDTLFFTHYWATFYQNLSSKRILGAIGLLFFFTKSLRRLRRSLRAETQKLPLPPRVPQTLTTRPKQTQNVRPLAMKLDKILICADSLIQVSYLNWPHKNIHCRHVQCENYTDKMVLLWFVTSIKISK